MNRLKLKAHPIAGCVALAAVGLLSGCAASVRRDAAASTDKPPEAQSLAEMRPSVTLPAPVNVPDDPASTEALEAYARGRDALLRNQKAVAIQHLTAAVEADGHSAVAWRDLGYAQLGMDDGKAAAAFRQAVGLDPADADSRLQLARLLLTTKKSDEAVTELRIVRLTPDYTESAGLAAVVDLLLGQLLEQANYRTAALECFEGVLSIVDERVYDLRGRPELADVLGRPGLLVLRTADLATQCGRYPRAIELYRRLQTQEPQSALTLELRLARAELAAGDRRSATGRALDFVRRSGASPLSLALVDELYDPYGGPPVALAEVAKLGQGSDDSTSQLLRSHLLIKQGDAAGAVAAVDRVSVINLAVVRQTVHAYRAAGREGALIPQLLRRTAAAPSQWRAWERGWAMLTHLGQTNPLRAERLLDLSVDPPLQSVRDFVASTLLSAQGRQASAAAARQRAIERPSSSEPVSTPSFASRPSFDVQAAEEAPPLNLNDLDEVSSSKELAVLIDAYRDDPELLTATIAEALRAGQKRMALDAFEAVSAGRPTDPVIAGAYAQTLAADDRRAEAGTVLEKATAAASSAPPLYLLASQYSGIGDGKSAERVLRRAYDRDPAFAAVCNDLGYLLADQGRELAFAETLLTRAVTLEPDNAAYLDSLGWLLYKRSKFAEAAERLEAAAELTTPVDPVVLDHAGDALYQHKQPGKSQERWQQAVDAIKQRGSSDPQLRLRIEQKLRQLKANAPVPVAPVAKAD